MKLNADEIDDLGQAIGGIIRRRQRSGQRLVPLHEATSILESIKAIRDRASSAETMLHRHETAAALMDLQKCVHQCDLLLISIHAPFQEHGRTRPK